MLAQDQQSLEFFAPVQPRDSQTVRETAPVFAQDHPIVQLFACVPAQDREALQFIAPQLAKECFCEEKIARVQPRELPVREDFEKKACLGDDFSISFRYAYNT